MYTEISIESIIEKLISHQAVLFVGAGISLAPPSNMPSGKAIREGLKNAFMKCHDLQELIQDVPKDFLDNINSQEILYNTISEYAIDKVPSLTKILESDRSNINHFLISKLMISGYLDYVITTNFDTLIENTALEDSIRIIIGMQNSLSFSRKPTLWKIHGTVDLTPAITLTDVYQIGFTDTPYLFEKLIENKILIIAGYSGNDPYILNSIVRANPKEVCWFVIDKEQYNIPISLKTLEQNGIKVSIRTGNLEKYDDTNPFISIWKGLNRRGIFSDNPPSLDSGYQNIEKNGFNEFIDGLSIAQKGLIISSLIRRAGLEHPISFRKKLSQLIWWEIYKHGGSAAHAVPYEKDDEIWLTYFENMFLPHFEQRKLLNKEYTERTKNEKKFNESENIKILMDYGLEKLAYVNFKEHCDEAIDILTRAFKIAKNRSGNPLKMQVSKALSWVYLRKGDRKNWYKYNLIADKEYFKLKNIRDSIETMGQCGPNEVNQVLKDINYNKDDYPVLYCSSTDALSLLLFGLLIISGWLRNFIFTGNLDKQLIENSEKSSDELLTYMRKGLAGKDNEQFEAISKVLKWHKGFIFIERGKSMFLEGNYKTAIDELNMAKEQFEGNNSTDCYVEGIRYWAKTVRQFYVKLGDFKNALISVFDEGRI